MRGLEGLQVTDEEIMLIWNAVSSMYAREANLSAVVIAFARYLLERADAVDARRYRWLRDSDRIPDGEADGHLIVGEACGEDVLWGDQLDKAIDAALSQSAKEAT